jgi:hypothetical protein
LRAKALEEVMWAHDGRVGNIHLALAALQDPSIEQEIRSFIPGDAEELRRALTGIDRRRVTDNPRAPRLPIEVHRVSGLDHATRDVLINAEVEHGDRATATATILLRLLESDKSIVIALRTIDIDVDALVTALRILVE